MFGMTLLERLLRGLQQTRATFSEIRVELAGGAPIPDSLPEKLVAALPLQWSRDDHPLAQRFERAMRAADGDPVLALAADTAVDARVIAHLCEATGSFVFIHGEDEERGALPVEDREQGQLDRSDNDVFQEGNEEEHAKARHRDGCNVAYMDGGSGWIQGEKMIPEMWDPK